MGYGILIWVAAIVLQSQEQAGKGRPGEASCRWLQRENVDSDEGRRGGSCETGGMRKPRRSSKRSRMKRKNSPRVLSPALRVDSGS